MIWLFIIFGVIMTGIFLRTAYVLYKGGDGRIAGYSGIPREDRKYYDDGKVKKFAAFMNLGYALGCLTLGLTAFFRTPVLIVLAILLFVIPAGVFRYLLTQTSFFIKKD